MHTRCSPDSCFMIFAYFSKNASDMTTSMKQVVLSFILTSGAYSIALAQDNVNFYKFSSGIQADIGKDTTAWKYQTAAVHYSFTGDHKNTLQMWDKAVQSRPYVPKATDSAYLKNAKQQDARDYILERAKAEEIIIINEAHHNPMHRRFTAGLLKDLYRQGYRYLGLEALADSAVNERNYATKESGYYTNEAEFGNLIFEARKLGFILFGYEAAEGKNGKEREIEQARNIQQFKATHPGGKMIIHCGFDHVYEGGVRNWEKAMAGRLKEYTGIDPFTIDQVKFSEKSSPELSHYFVYATSSRAAFILTNPEEGVFRGISSPHQTDIAVIHPMTRYINERPHWRASGRKAYRLPENTLKSGDYPVQVLAYRTGEEAKGIPADIIELENVADRKPLYLAPGRYILISRDKTYQVIHTNTITVK